MQFFIIAGRFAPEKLGQLAHGSSDRIKRKIVYTALPLVSDFERAVKIAFLQSRAERVGGDLLYTDLYKAQIKRLVVCATGQ